MVGKNVRQSIALRSTYETQLTGSKYLAEDRLLLTQIDVVRRLPTPVGSIEQLTVLWIPQQHFHNRLQGNKFSSEEKIV